ncbi:MAG: hypothetical protein EOO28_03825 [Comamonadaceae bacterium]|nr:MAG: hypothetical protein EOO28_03825 [Comamonadaceae bacterium]
MIRISTQATDAVLGDPGKSSDQQPAGIARPAGELRIWLTRRLTLGLIPALQKHAAEQLSRSLPSPSTHADPAASVEVQRERLLDAFKLEAAAYGSDFSKPYQPPPATAENTQTAQDDPTSQPAQLAAMLSAPPLLITEVVIALQASGQLQMKFSQKLEATSKDIDLALQPQLAQGLLHLLNLGVQQSGWLEIPAQPAGKGQADALAAMAGIERTGYLN